jgi:integrase
MVEQTLTHPWTLPPDPRQELSGRTKNTGVPLDVAAIQFARSMADGNGSVASVQSAQSPPAVKALPVAEVVDELLAIKKAKGRSHLYLADLRIRLTRFAKALDRPLCEITSSDIDKFLESLEISARSQNNFRAVVGTLFRFGQSRGYVGRDHPGVSHVDKASHAAQDVQVFTPEELVKLMRAAKDKLVPAIAIGAFAGIRSEELKRLTWEDVHFKEGHIEIRSAKSKTKVRRLIPIQKNLKVWLLPHAQEAGIVVPFSNLALQFGKLARRAGVKWKKNGSSEKFLSGLVQAIEL